MFVLYLNGYETENECKHPFCTQKNDAFIYKILICGELILYFSSSIKYLNIEQSHKFADFERMNYQ